METYGENGTTLSFIKFKKLGRGITFLMPHTVAFFPEMYISVML